LEELLQSISGDPGNNPIIPFGRLGNVHFARLLIVPATLDLDGRPIPHQLVLSTNIDGSVGDHLPNLVDVADTGLDKIFSHCEGYPSGDSITRQDRLQFLRARMFKAQAFYVNTVGRTLAQVRQEAELREAIQDFLDKEGQERNWAAMRPADVHAAVEQFVNSEPSLAWATKPPEPPDIWWRIRQTVRRFGIPLVLIALAPLVIFILPIYLVILRHKEKTDVPDDSQPDIEQVKRTSAIEDYFAQNPFCGTGFIKPGIFRGVTVRVALWMLRYGVEHIYNNGSLTGVTTIHFARWVITNNGRGTLFMSNYDGSLESYMSDFIDKVAWGLNLVFSNGAGWPRTRWLVAGGASNELAFKSFLRFRQVYTQVWYTAYGNLTAVNIANNAAIRAGLCRPLDGGEAEEWARRL
jgi:hypothetical protein